MFGKSGVGKRGQFVGRCGDGPIEIVLIPQLRQHAGGQQVLFGHHELASFGKSPFQ